MRMQIIFADSKYFNPLTWITKKHLNINFSKCAIYDPQRDEVYEKTFTGIKINKYKKWLKTNNAIHTYEIKTSTTRNDKIICSMRSNLNSRFCINDAMNSNISSEFTSRTCYYELGHESSKLDKETPLDVLNRVTKIKKWTQL